MIVDDQNQLVETINLTLNDLANRLTMIRLKPRSLGQTQAKVR